MRRLAVLASVFSLFVFQAFADELSLASGAGVQIKAKLTTDEDLDQIKETGFDTVRIGMPWPEVENQKGRYDWAFFDEFLPKLKARGLRAVITLGRGNALYSGRIKAPRNPYGMKKVDAAPKEDEEVEAYVAFAAAAVERYGAEGILWTIWNEPDSAIFWPPEPDADAYADLAEKACRAMKEKNPHAVVVAPDLAKMPQKSGKNAAFLKTLLRSGAMGCLDALSVHPYRDGSEKPETVQEAYRVLCDLIRRHAPEGRENLPVLSTEWGYSTVWASEEQQAAYAVRALLINRLAGIPVSIWYEWRSQGDDDDDPEDQFGFFVARKREKESFAEVESVLPKLRELFLVKALEVDDPRVRAVLAKDEGEKIFIIAWIADEKKGAKRSLSYRNDDGPQEVELSLMPVIVEAKDADVRIVM